MDLLVILYWEVLLKFEKSVRSDESIAYVTRESTSISVPINSVTTIYLLGRMIFSCGWGNGEKNLKTNGRVRSVLCGEYRHSLTHAVVTLRKTRRESSFAQVATDYTCTYGQLYIYTYTKGVQLTSRIRRTGT